MLGLKLRIIWGGEKLTPMTSFVERFPVEQLYLWSGLMVIISVSVIVSIRAGQGSITDWTVIVGGASMLFGAVYGGYTRDPDEFTMNGYWVGFLVFAALLIAFGAAFSIAGF